MSLAHVFAQDLFQQCFSNCAPIVFVVDNDISVRESLDLLNKSLIAYVTLSFVERRGRAMRWRVLTE
jgi:hypothetical protein